ncbi:MAG: hypothetical protein BGN91_11620 [Nitrobacter sp. 62-13]|nr:MAG: hypothetical protein BGN91_11620 [Nitrobacter sp. 62-13]
MANRFGRSKASQGTSRPIIPAAIAVTKPSSNARSGWNVVARIANRLAKVDAPMPAIALAAFAPYACEPFESRPSFELRRTLPCRQHPGFAPF